MAFDKTKAPVQAAATSSLEDTYGLEFGRTYVPPEEVRDFLLLAQAEACGLAAWADALIPGDGEWPSASAVDSHLYVDNCCARSPLLRSMLLRGLQLLERAADEAHGRDFASCSPDTRAELLRELESGSGHAIFDLVLELVFEGYYRAPRVLEVVERRTGFVVAAPLEGAPLDAFDESLLERVRSLPPLLGEPAA